MNAGRQLLLIASRDFVQRARSKSFIMTMVIIIGLIVGMMFVVRSEFDPPEAYQLGVLVDRDERIDESILTMAEFQDTEVELSPFPDAESATAAVQSEEIDAALVDDGRLEWKSAVDARLASIVASAVANLARSDAILSLGLTEDEAMELLAPPVPVNEVLEVDTDEDIAQQVAGIVASILLYMSILVFGSFILLGVMEEKQSRVVEVLLSRVKAESLLAGKILGIGTLGLVQLVVIGLTGLLSLRMVDLPDLDLPSLGLSTLLTVGFWFMLGFSLYAVIYGSLGAMVTRQEDAQSANLVPVALLIPGYLISFRAIDEPDSAAVTIASLVPFTSPVVMPARLGATEVPMWQNALAVLLIVVTTYLMVKIAARLYRGAVLSIGAKVRIRDAWRRHN